MNKRHIAAVHRHIAAHGAHSVNLNDVQQDSLTVGDRIAAAITNGVGTLYCAIFFSLISLVSLPSALATRSPVVIVGWVSSYFLQLVLLSFLQISQNRAGAHSEARAILDLHVNQESFARLEVIDRKLDARADGLGQEMAALRALVQQYLQTRVATGTVADMTPKDYTAAVDRTKPARPRPAKGGEA